MSSENSGMPSSEMIRSKLGAPKVETWTSDVFKITATKSHIMGSKCCTPEECSQSDDKMLCDLCRFSKIFGDRHLPNMIFSKNILRIEHKSGGAIEFTSQGSLEGLRDSDVDNIQVSHAKAWKEARSDCEYIHNVKADYDWTYTTDYCGSILGDLQVEPSEERININKISTREPIRFFQELYLFEDELDDNGASNCVVKIRCMDSGWLVLLRHYLRVDHVLVRVKETRLYHSTGTDYIIRERVTKMKEIPQDADNKVFKCPDAVSQHLDVLEERIDKIVLP